MFTCGATNFSTMDQDDPPSSAPSTPKSKKQKPNKNPYAMRGLDKFSMVLAELETKKEKIMEKAGSEGVAMVRFMCDNTRDSWVPIIIRPPKDQAKTSMTSEVMIKNKVAAYTSTSTEMLEKTSSEVKREERKKKKKRRLVLRWRDVYHWPLVMVVILVCLMMFGRVFAICCTCIWWYMVPNCMSLDNLERKGYGVVKRKEMGRRLSDKRLGGNLVNVQVQGKKR